VLHATLSALTSYSAEVTPRGGLDTATDAELVEAARRGDALAKQALFRRHARLVNGLAYRLLGRRDEVDDVVQDAFVQVLRNLHRLENPQAFASWVATIVVFTVRKRLRRRKLARALGLGDRTSADVDALVGTASPEAVADVRRVYQRIELLDPEERIALVLHRVDGCTLPELCEQMQLSLATVKRRIQSAERKLGIEHEP
jgi:RNA polymerase sigma-70 factor, ECF subfamily